MCGAPISRPSSRVGPRVVRALDRLARSARAGVAETRAAVAADVEERAQLAAPVPEDDQRLAGDRAEHVVPAACEGARPTTQCHDRAKMRARSSSEDRRATCSTRRASSARPAGRSCWCAETWSSGRRCVSPSIAGSPGERSLGRQPSGRTKYSRPRVSTGTAEVQPVDRHGIATPTGTGRMNRIWSSVSSPCETEPSVSPYVASRSAGSDDRPGERIRQRGHGARSMMDVAPSPMRGSSRVPGCAVARPYGRESRRRATRRAFPRARARVHRATGTVNSTCRSSETRPYLPASWLRSSDPGLERHHDRPAARRAGRRAAAARARREADASAVDPRNLIWRTAWRNRGRATPDRPSRAAYARDRPSRSRSAR